MAKTLTLFEHEAKPFDWQDRDLVLLERLRRSAEADVLRATVRAGKRHIQATQYVGVIRSGSRSIQILPKIFQAPERASEEIRVREATANLLRMLAYSGDLKVREHELAQLMRQKDNWFEMLTRLFATHLRDEWQRGAHRSYHVVEEELPLLKGKWRIAEQLRAPIRRHIFSVSYDEFGADIPLNRVFRFVVERLWHLTHDSENRKLLGELRQWMEEVTLLPRVSISDANPDQLTRLNERYRPLLNLARMFLDGGTLQLAAGNLSTFAFVFDMNRLFESFIAVFIRRHSSEILSEELRACEFLVQSRGEFRHLARREGRDVFQTKPDIVFRSRTNFPLIIDTKYKRLAALDLRLGVAQSDFYQMHAYAHRYDCSHIVLLYPQTAETEWALAGAFTLADGDKVITAATVNLTINLARKDQRQLLVDELRVIFAKGTP